MNDDGAALAIIMLVVFAWGIAILGLLIYIAYRLS